MKNLNFYFIPTLYIERIKQRSLSVNKVPYTKNDWEILINCKNADCVFQKFKVKKGS